MSSQTPNFPLLALPLHASVDDELDVDDIDALLIPSFTPQNLQRGVYGDDNRPNSMLNNRPALQLSEFARRILDGGGLSFALMQASSRIYQLVVDVAGVPQVTNLVTLKNLITDSWIVTSNSLAPVSGQLKIEEAIVRGLLMLLIKRVLGIKQLGPIREVLSIFNFVGLAAIAMKSMSYNPDLSQTLSQISSIPILLYTSLARLIVDAASQNWLLDQLPNLLKNAQSFKIGVDVKGHLGRGGQKLKTEWENLMSTNKELQTFVARNTPKNYEQQMTILFEFNRNFM
jgi:hypothetical protein